MRARAAARDRVDDPALNNKRNTLPPPKKKADLFGAVKVSESYWTLEDGELHVTLTKAAAGEPWRCAIAGHELDAVAEQRDTQRLMLERFQREVRLVVFCVVCLFVLCALCFVCFLCVRCAKACK